MSDTSGFSIDPWTILGKIVEMYNNDQERAAEDAYKRDVMGSLEANQRQLSDIYVQSGMLSALLLDEVNRLPANITRGEIGGFMANVRDRWSDWHASANEASRLFWRGDELFHRLVSDVRLGSPPLQYAVATDLANLLLIQCQLAEKMGTLLRKADRTTTFNSYATFFEFVCTNEPGTLGDRIHQMGEISRMVAADANSVTLEEKQLKIGSIGKGNFSPQAFEDCYREQTADPNAAQWRVRVYAWGGPDFTPPFTNTISPEMFVSYLKDPAKIPRLSAVVQQHQHDWTDQEALKAHAVAHQNAINIPGALVGLLETRTKELDQLAGLCWRLAILAMKRAA